MTAFTKMLFAGAVWIGLAGGYVPVARAAPADSTRVRFFPADKSTNVNPDTHLELTFQILEGDLKGRQVWARLNLHNPNAQTVKIARGELSAICRAVDVMTPRDSVDLHNLPMVITVRCKKREDTGEISNEVRGYAKREAANGVPQQATTDTPPWMRT